jgi:hypothetical protein
MDPLTLSQFADVPVSQAFLQALLAAAPLVGKLLGGMSSKRADGRKEEIDIGMEQDQAALNRAHLEEQQRSRQQRTGFDQADLDMRRREYTDTSRTQGYRDRAQGGLLQGLEDAVVTAPDGIRMGTVTGGLRPSAIVNRKQLGRDMESSAKSRGMLGPQFDAVETVGAGAIPGATPMPQAGRLDKFLNIASLIGNGLGIVNEVRNPSGADDTPTTASVLSNPNFTPNMAQGNYGRVSNRLRFR